MLSSREPKRAGGADCSRRWCHEGRVRCTTGRMCVHEISVVSLHVHGLTGACVSA